MTKEKKKPIEAILIGAGTRGRDAYGKYALNNPHRLRFIAIADKDDRKRKIFQKLHNIGEENVFTSSEEILSTNIGKLADVAFICTPDREHFDPAMKALNLGYDLVLEKPIAPTKEECVKISKLAERKGKLVQICHVLRYTDFWKKVKSVVKSGEIGKIVHVDHSENVSYWHFGHSFVRGPYKNKETSTPIVLAKTCHDLDLIYWILEEKAQDVHSTGTITHYKPENAPRDTPKRCTDGCPIENECPWYAPRLYVDLEPILRIGLYSKSKTMRFITKLLLKSKFFVNIFSLFSKGARKIKNWDQFPITHITEDYSFEGRMKALKEGPYGLCIYKTGNDVPDHQISTFNYSDGKTATLTMHGFSEHEGREIKIFGTKGVLRGIFRNNVERIEVTDFRFGKIKTIHDKGLSFENHGGGDTNIMNAFTKAFQNKSSNRKESLTDVSSAMESHFMAFAAEESRITNKIVEIKDFRE